LAAQRANTTQFEMSMLVQNLVISVGKRLFAAAARGLYPISANFLLPKWVKTNWPSYVEGCNKSRIKTQSKHWRIAKSIFVCEDRNKAKEYALGNESQYIFYYKQLLTKILKHGRAIFFKDGQSPPDCDLNFEEMWNKLVINGSSDEVFDKLIQFREEVGYLGTLLYDGHDWKDLDLTKKSM
jgi:hypothetical protein